MGNGVICDHASHYVSHTPSGCARMGRSFGSDDVSSFLETCCGERRDRLTSHGKVLGEMIGCRSILALGGAADFLVK